MGNVVVRFDGDFDALRKQLRALGWEVGERPNAPVFGRGPGVTLHAYATGKILLAGERAEVWADHFGPPIEQNLMAAKRIGSASADAKRPGWVLHFDGACMPRNPGGVAAYGFQVLHDGALVHEGHGLASPPGPLSTNNVAEFTGLAEGLRWIRAHARAGEPILVRGDSRLVVETVTGRWKIHAPHLVGLHGEAVRLLRELGATIEWVPRERNGDADRLSRVGYDNAVRAHPEWRK